MFWKLLSSLIEVLTLNFSIIILFDSDHSFMIILLTLPILGFLK